MKIFDDIKLLVEKEKHYTALILKNLVIIDTDKMFCDLGHNSLHTYLVKELGYSSAEATVRVHAVRLMRKSESAVSKIEEGSITLTNAAEAHKAYMEIEDEVDLEDLVLNASNKSTRAFKDYVAREYKKEREEILVLKGYMIDKFDSLRKKYGDLSTLDLLELLFEIEKKESLQNSRGRPRASTKVSKVSRNIPLKTKREVNNGVCENCGVMWGLEYDHIVKHSHGGTNSKENIQMLCRSCNQRKEIKLRQTNLFG